VTDRTVSEARRKDVLLSKQADLLEWNCQNKDAKMMRKIKLESKSTKITWFV